MNIYLDKLDQQLETLCQQYSQGMRRKPNAAYSAIMKQRKQLLLQGEAEPAARDSLKPKLRERNRRILQTPAYDYNDLTYTRVKFLRYADDVAIAVIGPKSLARQVIEEMATFLWAELKLQLNREKTRITHLPTEQARFLGYVIKTATPRWRRRNMRRKRSPHNVVQTVKTTSGNIKLLVPLRRLSEKLQKYMANGQPACMDAFINQPIDHIIGHYNGVIRGWYNYYQLAENVSSLNYARYILQYSLAKTLARKEGTSVSKVFRKYGKDITFQKPNSRHIHFYNQPLIQVKRAKKTRTDVDVCPTWYPKKTRTRLMDNCVICDSSERIEMHHVRHIRKRGQHIQGFTLYLAAINRKQIPVCKQGHRDIHRGKYDGPSLSAIQARIQARQSEYEAPQNEVRPDTAGRRQRAA